MKGRKPIPTTIKLLNASRKDRINKNEPKPAPGTPTAPHKLDKLGVKAFNLIVELGNWLTPADSVVVYCLAEALSHVRAGARDVGAAGLDPPARAPHSGRLPSPRARPRRGSGAGVG